MPIRAFREFIRYEAAAGFLLFAAATVAIILANTALAPIYGHLLDVPLAISVGASGLAKPLLLWINDGLMVGLIILSRLGVERVAAYVLFGVALWVFVLKIGVHATLAGVLVALAVPMRSRTDRERSPLKELEHDLHPWVAYGILPLFAFANAGVSFAGVTPSSLLEPVPLGIAAGLFLGKQLGVFLPILAAIRLGIAEKPEGTTWLQIYGVAALCGVGFTMSLFIGSLAFENPDDDQSFAAPIRLGVLSGSLLSGLLGYFLVRFGAAIGSRSVRPDP